VARAEADFNLLEQKQKDRYSQPEMARVEAQKEEAVAAYNAAEDILRQMNIRAPFTGVLYSLPVRQGVYLNPGDLVLEEADLTKVRVRAFVDEPDVGRLMRGQKIELTWDAIPGRIWTGTLDTIPASLKLHGTRNVGEVTCTVENKDLGLLPNVNVGVTIVTNEDRNVLLMPREALRIDDKNNTYVYAVQNDALQRLDVQTSHSNLTAVEITGGVSEKDVVALGSINGRPLRNHLAVQVIR
jgi:HlyD family secretion protein